MTLGVPLNAFNTALMALPDLFRYVGHVDGPEIDLVARCSSKLTIILPSNIHYLAFLLKHFERLLFDCGWVPDQNIGVISPRRDKSVTLVPAGVNQTVFGVEETFELSLHAPNSCNVIISAC